MKQIGHNSRVWPLVVPVLLFAAAALVAAVPQSLNTQQTPTQVVEEYCHVDLNGARVSSDNPYVDKYFSLVSWQNEAGFGEMDITRECRLLSTSVHGKTAEVAMEYENIGTIDEYTVHKAWRKERVLFKLTSTSGKWIIVHPMIRPHLSVSALISNFEDLLSREKNPSFKRKYEGVITNLKALSGK
jgi:hypothetical protein